MLTRCRPKFPLVQATRVFEIAYILRSGPNHATPGKCWEDTNAVKATTYTCTSEADTQFVGGGYFKDIHTPTTAREDQVLCCKTIKNAAEATAISSTEAKGERACRVKNDATALKDRTACEMVKTAADGSVGACNYAPLPVAYYSCSNPGSSNYCIMYTHLK